MIFVTGATGFIGRHTVQALLDKGHKVTVIFRDLEKLESMPWFYQVDGIMCDLYEDCFPLSSRIKAEDTLIHLAWNEYTKVTELFQLTQNLPKEITFLTTCINLGLKHLAITGTCFEYGLQNGPFTTTQTTIPITSYVIAKDSLCKILSKIACEKKILLQWVRLFYIYGAGQNPKSLYPLVQVAAFLTNIVEDKTRTGIINCCSGHPISVRRLVESWGKGR